MKKRILIFLLVFCAMSVSANSLDGADISAECAVVIAEQTGEVVFQKNENLRHSMASTTKIMTALIAAESGRLNDEISVSADMLLVEGTSMGLVDGDSVSLRELVYGMLLASGNDAANVTAVHLGGSVENFAKLMNQKAVQIGMKNTSFVTPSGLDDEKHYSTAYDMALLGRYAVQNPVIRSVCSAKKATLTYGNPPYKRTLYNHNRLLSSYEYALGIKTGFTKKSGRCLVSYAQKDGVGLIGVTLNASDDWNDHRKMLDHGFSVLETETVEAKLPQKVTVVGGNVENLSIKCEPFQYSFVKKGDITQKIFLERFVYAPVKKGDKLGEAVLYLDGERIASSDIVAAEDIEALEEKQREKSFFEKFKERLYHD